MKRLYLFALCILSFAFAKATPNWAEHVAPILFNNCASCHRPGGIAPTSLLTYNDAVALAYPMSGAITSGHMPPWPPAQSFNPLAHARVLTTSEKQTILDWCAGGVPQGNASLAPPVPVFPANGMLPGTPDLTLQIPAYTSQATGNDLYKCFVIPAGTLTDKLITAFEAVPGNPGIVHHVLVYADTTGECAAMDAADPGPGYTSGGGGVGQDDATLLGAWVPGTQPQVYPTSFGVKLPANADIVIQIHYPAGTIGQVDSTEMHFKLADPAWNSRELFILPALNHSTNINEPISIPPNTTKWFHEQQNIGANDLTLVGVAPHMHLIGRSIRSYGVFPNGDTSRFIDIPDWDFHWQGFYLLKQLRKIPAFTTVYADAYYDNTTANPWNPNNPPQHVYAGEATTDEMMIVYYTAAGYWPGDENIVIDTTTEEAPTGLAGQPYYRGQMLLEPYPIPARNELIAKLHLDEPATVALEVLDGAGRTVYQAAPWQAGTGYSTRALPVSGLAAGQYFLRMRAGQAVRTVPVVIAR